MDDVVRSFEHEFEGTIYRFTDLCVKGGAPGQCQIYSSPLQFYETAEGAFDLSSLTSDAALVERI